MIETSFDTEIYFADGFGGEEERGCGLVDDNRGDACDWHAGILLEDSLSAAE